MMSGLTKVAAVDCSNAKNAKLCAKFGHDEAAGLPNNLEKVCAIATTEEAKTHIAPEVKRHRGIGAQRHTGTEVQR